MGRVANRARVSNTNPKCVIRMAATCKVRSKGRIASVIGKMYGVFGLSMSVMNEVAKTGMITDIRTLHETLTALVVTQ